MDGIQIKGGRMKGLLVAASALVLASGPLSAQRPAVPKASDAELISKLAKGETLETRIDGDLNGDGRIDTAFVGRGEDSRTLYVVLAVREETFSDHDLIGKGPLDVNVMGKADLALSRGALLVSDLAGGTTAISGTYRLRYEPATKRMRLIGLDTMLYSRTWQHDGSETSWNLLTGGCTTRVLKLQSKDGPYSSGPQTRCKRPIRPVYLEKLPDIEELALR
jgi:hypothetical protein